MAVAPNEMVAFAESAGLAAVAYGLDSQAVEVSRRRRLEDPESDRRVARSYRACHAGLGGEGHDADGAGRWGRPALAATTSRRWPPTSRSITAFRWLRCISFRHSDFGWLHWRITKEAEDAYRFWALGLPETPGPATRSLEIQAYDEVYFPGLAAEWAEQSARRRRALTLAADGCRR